MRARDAFVVVAVALAGWGLLFAPILERNAESGPVGARRSVALAVLRPLSTVSDALAFDRVNDHVASALGRDPDAQPGGELELPELDLPPLFATGPTGIGNPDRPTPDVTTSPPPEAEAGDEPVEHDRPKDDPDEPEGPVVGIRTPSANAKLRVAVVGDSLSQGLGPTVAQWFVPDVSRVLPLGRQSTGLARQDYFNWRLAMRRIEQEFRPDLVFVMLGVNDNQAQITADGASVPVGSVAWVQAYRERAEAFLREATSNGTHVVWIGVPVVRDHQRWAFYRRVNGIFRDVASADPFATYLDAWKLFATRSGAYSAYLRNERGILQGMRAGDGVHFTPAGYDYLARSAIRLAAERFDLPQRAVVVRV